MNLFGIEPLTPAYGRDYKSKKAIQADFDAGKDFLMSSGSYVDQKSLAAEGVHKIMARYAKQTKVTTLTVRP